MYLWHKGTFIQSHGGSAYIFSRDPKDKIINLEDDYPGNNNKDMILSFISSILDEKKPEITIQEILDSMLIVLEIENSVLLKNKLLKYARTID